MFPTVARCFASASSLKPRLARKIESLDENQVVANTIRAILLKYGPVTVTDCWNYAKEGVKSKTQMKIILRWLREKQDVRVTCQHFSNEDGASSSKEFLFSLNSTHSVVPDA